MLTLSSYEELYGVLAELRNMGVLRAKFGDMEFDMLPPGHSEEDSRAFAGPPEDEVLVLGPRTIE